MINNNPKRHNFYHLVKNPEADPNTARDTLVLQLGEETYNQDHFQRETELEGEDRYAVVRYKDLNGAVLYQESHDQSNNIITTLSYNKDASIEKTVIQNADDGTVLDLIYKEVPTQGDQNADTPMHREKREQHDIADKDDDEIIKTYYGTKLSSSMQAVLNDQGNPILATSYHIKRSDAHDEAMHKVFNKKIGRNVSVTAGFSETRCHDRWETCINGASYQINCIPSTFSMRHLEDFRMDGHHFVEAVRVVNRLPLVANTITFGPEEEISLNAIQKLNGGILDISFYSLYIEINAGVQRVQRKIRDFEKFGTSVTDGGPPPPPGRGGGMSESFLAAGGGGSNPPSPPGGGGSAISRSSSTSSISSSSSDGGSSYEQKSRLYVTQSEFHYDSSDTTTTEVEHQSMIT